MHRIMLPYTHHIVSIVEVIYRDDANVPVRPVKGAEKETRTDGNPDAPGKPYSEVGPHIIAGPWSPIDRGISRPPPWAIDSPRIVVRHIDHLGVWRLDHDSLSLLVHSQLIS